ncbi:myosin regulatory light chain 2, ventricular/cardiac muscle isoform isoform X1 [Falco biarmicus]|uniref:myosin regulatory light chain 2A, cardiac muscle isoform-like isoform X1 n=1 Tax=Falco rusticolus TaxID=120794 RepID=UPI0018866410|nr:myosin regulatory light chain 2A, cardiac muscle isoform-like isoform X1 [Falco rusticolus]XP_037231443.1 myosin regulatory light chain 2A, cardiac muscle isoform-like isoform X1 [Falco rusticolus]XP_037231451.1 myosin regulatory light chain 2A, cardiac muscle isoform-like isoform X1 [Falco rusticolus]XP_055552346.1 myosin regulatory light chain 2A, cardiac muscle isoform-like isoform X1 [Falco cherrug]XP_055556927.1 myosin regulatory light chain 2A, cardiac muscle isoform-like isoform X1 [F
MALCLLLYMPPPTVEVPAAGSAFLWAPHFPAWPSPSPQRLGEAGGCSWLPPPPPPTAVAMSPAGADPEETILNAFKVFDPEGKGLKSAYIKEMLMTQGERFSQEEVDQMFAAFPPDISGNLDYKNLVHIITHGEED